VACEVAIGAAIGGARAMTCCKHVGLNVMADPVFTASYTGVNGGLVIAVADDPGMHSSQNEQDSRHYAMSAKLPMLEPSDSAEAREFAMLAFELSERFDTPVLLKMCTRIAHAQSLVETGERVVPEPRPYVKDPAKYVMTPANAIRRHPTVEARMQALGEWAETAAVNRIDAGEDTSVGFITSSTCYQYVKEVCGDRYPVLKLGMVWPLPEKKIRGFAASVGKLIVVEELDPFLENYCRTLGLAVTGKEIFPIMGEFSQNLVAACLGETAPAGCKLDETVPGRPPVMCPGCPHRGLFYTLANNNCTVMGDIGCYTLGAAPPLKAIDVTLCMGASIGSQHGYRKAGGSGEKLVSVIGDSTFMHSGMTGLANVAYNQSDSTVIILDNSITGMTGHQQNPTTGLNIKGEPAGKIDLEALCRSMGIRRVRVVDPYRLDECDAVLKEELAAEEPSVIISRRPCALLKHVKAKPPLKIDAEKCRSCKSCMRIGCPAISMKDGRARIDNTLCVGCGVCAQLCKFGAFSL
jgi:indolepyruvate ferredoxin oxidoreductase alpha subunit